MADYRACSNCGQWFTTDDMQIVIHGKHRAYYCEDCTYKLLFKRTNGGTENESEHKIK